MVIGLCGTGKMGAAMGERLLDVGHELVVWNRTAARAAPLLARGARQVTTPAALVADCEAVLLMLFDDAAVEQVYGGEQGLLSAPLAGRLVVDMSTVLPGTAAEMARRVAAARGRFVECPVGGTVAPACEGQLLGMAGGEAGAVRAAWPLLTQLCRRVEHVGEAGCGAAMKLAINLPLIVYWEAVGESLALSAGAGIPATLAADLLADSAGAIAMARARLPAVLERLHGGPAGPAHFALGACAKDLRLAVQVARERGATAPVARAALDSYRQAVEAGWGDADFPMQAAWRAGRSASPAPPRFVEAAQPLRRVQDPGRIDQLADALARGALTAQELAQRYLERIDAVDAEVQAWRVVDADRVLAAARDLDRQRETGGPVGPLHGIPVAVKDVIDVEGLPTRCNCLALEERAAATADARVVADLRAAGALVMGKAHTTEFALMDPSPARNPHNLQHTPGGSSSGSAAAVAAGMVPAALGTQTVASVNRPAAYCGIAAYKPSTGLLSTFGVAPLAPLFDTVGFFGHRVADATALFEAVCPAFAGAPAGAGARPLRVVVLQDPVLERCVPAVTAAMAGAAAALGAGGHVVTTMDACVSFQALFESHARCARYETARAHRSLLDQPPELIGEHLRAAILEGLAFTYEQYRAALTVLARGRAELFASLTGVDAVLWPAAPDTAPRGLAWTGDPSLISPWTALGGPVVTVRVGEDGAGMPVGALLVGTPGCDARFTGIARRLAEVLEA
jgi:aspartyl-tRNA(Asn)/glutamyl-tRNA(Gln) amidotransferase subunit A